MADPLGLQSGVLYLVEYDPRWPALFVAERARIRDHCGVLALRLEHVGGTSIPGMCSKPVLDIAAGRPMDTPAENYTALLQRAGYEHRGERGIAGREFFCRGTPRSYHLHLVEEGGPLWRSYILFRDYLRAHEDVAREFSEVKRALAARFPEDREAYTNAKTAYAQEILRRATTG